MGACILPWCHPACSCFLSPMMWATLSTLYTLPRCSLLCYGPTSMSQVPMDCMNLQSNEIKKIFSPLNHQYLSQQWKSWASHAHLSVLYSIILKHSLSWNFFGESKMTRDCGTVVKTRYLHVCVCVVINIYPTFLLYFSCFFIFLARNVKVRRRHNK